MTDTDRIDRAAAIAPRLEIVPLELKDLNALVAALHRHHKPVQGHRFSLGVKAGDKLVGGCAVGRPVARMTDQRSVLEVTRLVTNGTKNACSALYAAAARVGREMGYRKIQTFILDTEPGTSLIAAGWQLDGESGGGYWTRESKPNRRQDQPQGKKRRYVKVLNAPPDECGNCDHPKSFHNAAGCGIEQCGCGLDFVRIPSNTVVDEGDEEL